MRGINDDRDRVLPLVEPLVRLAQALQHCDVGLRRICAARPPLLESLAQQRQRSPAVEDRERNREQSGQRGELRAFRPAQDRRIDDDRPAAAERDMRYRIQA